MATIATTTNAAPFQFPGNRLVCKQPGANRYIALVKASTADNYTFYKSTDLGANWASLCTVVRTNVQDIGSVFVDRYGWIIWAYRTNESSQDRIYIRVINSTSGAAVNEYLLASPGNGGVAGATYAGLDVISHYTASAYQYVVVAVGTRVGSSQGVTLHAAYADASGIYIPADGLISGTRRWLFTGAGSARIGPSIDKEHNGDGYTSSSPNLWISFGRDSLYLVKVPWTGNGWSGPTGSTLIYGSTGDDTTVGRWDGSRFLMAAPDPNATSQVVVLERNRANSTTTTRHTPDHTTGVVRQATLGYNTTNGNIRVFAVGTSSAVLYFVDYVRATNTWGAWTSTGLPAILGANVDNFGARVSTDGDARFGIYSAASGSPNTLTYTPQTVAFAPTTPTWISPNSGAAADVAVALPLTWAFSDPDPGDTQSAYAVSKQVGAGALSYWRASDATWQAAEVQNSAATSSITIPPGWAADTDAVHTFKVKVWDASALASGYSAGLMLVPSTPVNPAITAPTASQVIGSSSVPVTWTAAEQTQYRITLDRGGVLDTFTRTTASSWGTSDSGQAWTNTNGSAADFSTTGTVARHSNASVAVLRSSTADVGASDQDITVDAVINTATAAGASISQWVCARLADLSNYYVTQLILTTTGTVTLNLFKRTAGTLSGNLVPAVTVATSHASGDVWRIRLQVVGSTVQAKAWPAGASEPPQWTLSATDTSLTTGTQIGLLSRLETGNTNTLPVTTDYDNLLVVPGAVVDYDSGWVVDGATRTTTPPVVLSTGEAWVLTLRTRNTEGLESATQRVYFTVNFTPPMTPTTVATPIPSSGIMRVAITNPTPGGGAPALASQDLYRRVTGSGDPTGIRIATGLANNATYDDWAAVGGVPYDYRAVAIGTTGTTTTGTFTA